MYSLLTQCIHMLCMDLRTSMDCFPIHREFSSIQRNPNFQNSIVFWMMSRLRPPLHDINWLVSVTEERYYCAVRTNLKIHFWLNVLLKAAPTLWPLAAGLASRRPCFDPRPVKVRLVLDQVAMGQISFRVSVCKTNSTHAISRHAATSPHNIQRRNFIECFKRSVTLARHCTRSLRMVEDRNM